ncbi:Long-chain-fatty-acid--CoA ligase 4 [Acropora cervicornis]|uniref:long-chain-fatty-acid--CoA ligase n=1 Tax=Acropora cervicornis TaxID=6130 RepID=A0AAD9R6G0_ACRCE|nr:Long-chain-fatty-acid--CoA ligase 4 [Acropora cervicornis]
MERSIVESVFLFSLNLAGWLWGIVSFLPWYYLVGRKQYRPRSKVQARRVSQFPGAPYRCVERFDSLATSLYDGVYTMDQLFNRAVNLYPYRKCLGTREVLREEDEVQANGRVFKKVVCGEYSWLTYAQVDARAKAFGRGLAVLGQQTKENIVIFSETKADWMICAQGCFAQNFPIVTVYATLGDEALVHALNETEVRFIITDGSLLGKLSALTDELPKLEHVVFIGNMVKKSAMRGFSRRINIHSMQEVEEIGESDENSSFVRKGPSPDDIAVIMYTSGSTGLGKGVLISHGALMAGLAGLTSRVQPGVSEKDIYVGYLPLAHVLELMAETMMLAHGACIGYSSPLTLSDQASKIKKGSKGDVSVLRPTLMTAVPVIMDRIRHNVMEKVKEGPRLLQVFFSFAYSYKLKQLKLGYDTPLLNKFIFSKMQNLLGGRVRQIISGGAPLSEDTQYFMNVCFCCPVGQGYGLTETCAAATLMHVWDRTTGRVGPPIISTEIKLVDWEEGNYTKHDKPYPRGEIVIGGPSVTSGYYKNPEKTAESYEVDRNGQRWFHTGDIGELHPDGCLKIIDRKKDIVKLQAGEYVSLGKVEAALSHSQYIEVVCIYAQSSHSYVVCLAVPRPKQLKALAASLGVMTDEWVQLCKNKAITEAVLKDLHALGKAKRLEKFEIPQRLTLVSEQWTPDTELVTASLKLKRMNITAHYREVLEAMYSH